MNLANLFEQIILLSIMGSIVAIAILVIKAIFRQKLSAKIHYYIWFLLVLKLILPLNFQNKLSPINFINAESKKYVIASMVNQSISSSTTFKTNANKTQEIGIDKYNYKNSTIVNNGLGFNFKTAALIWMIGVLSIILYIIVVNIMLWIIIKKSPHSQRQDINEILEESKLRLKVNSKISVTYNKHLKSPFVYGIIRPKIQISENIIDRLPSEDLKFVLLHEVAHIKRKDLIVNVVIMLLQIIYWFNPLIWYSLYQFKQDCEVACDATALTVLSSKEVKEYGQTIIDMLKILSKQHLVIGTLSFSNKFSKRRIIMISLFNKKSITWTIAALSLVIMVGCSSTTKPLSDSTDVNKSTKVNPPISTVKSTATDEKPSSTNVVAKDSTDTSSKVKSQVNSQKTLLENIKRLAQQGKIINCNFPAKSTVIEDVAKKWGKADKSDWVAQAKGTYTTYSKHNVVFGSNKGDQIFEVRSFDSKLGQISLSMVTNAFGTPAYDVTSNGEEIIGYTAGKEFKILFVFPQHTKGISDPMLKHYSVLYPAGTINNMSEDPGRKW